jgi:hypothetical protein
MFDERSMNREKRACGDFDVAQTQGGNLRHHSPDNIVAVPEMVMKRDRRAVL